MKLAEVLQDGCWTEHAKDILRVHEIHSIEQLPKTNILSEITLYTALSPLRAKEIVSALHKKGVYAEVNRHGCRRCVHVDDLDKRCVSYCSVNYICDEHLEETAVNVPTIFRSPLLADAFKHHVNSPDKHSLDQEIALLRTMLTVVMGKLDDGITMGEVAAVTQLCDKIAAVVDKSAKLNVVTPEKLQTFMNSIVDVMAEFIPADKLQEAADRIERVNPLKQHLMVPYEPSKEIKSKDLAFQIQTASMQKKRLLEVAQHMGVTVDGVQIDKDVAKDGKLNGSSGPESIPSEPTES